MKNLRNKTDEILFDLTQEEKQIISEKIEIALQQIEDGDFLTEEEMDKEIDSW
jgi:predicted transcriptional regulator